MDSKVCQIQRYIIEKPKTKNAQVSLFVTLSYLNYSRDDLEIIHIIACIENFRKPNHEIHSHILAADENKEFL